MAAAATVPQAAAADAAACADATGRSLVPLMHGIFLAVQFLDFCSFWQLRAASTYTLGQKAQSCGVIDDLEVTLPSVEPHLEDGTEEEADGESTASSQAECGKENFDPDDDAGDAKVKGDRAGDAEEEETEMARWEKSADRAVIPDAEVAPSTGAHCPDGECDSSEQPLAPTSIDLLFGEGLGDEKEKGKGVEEVEYESVWTVIGGKDSGIIVRSGAALDSPVVSVKYGGSRMRAGALLREVELRGTRLSFELLGGGDGPSRGWVSTSTSGRPLLRKEGGPPEPGADSFLPRISPGIQMPQAPRIIWTYWDQGLRCLPAFQRLCLASWRRRLPGWRVEVVDRESILSFVSSEDLPVTFQDLSQRQHRGDCARAALLYRHGGVYMDPTILVFRSDVLKALRFEDIESGHKDYVGFFRHSQYMVENWFMACRRGCSYIERWHRLHLQYWETRTSVEKKFSRDPFFSGTDFRDFQDGEQLYLAQHACLAKLLRGDTEFQKMARVRAQLYDTWASQFGGTWLNRRLLAMAKEKADQKWTQRQVVGLRKRDQVGGGAKLFAGSKTFVLSASRVVDMQKQRREELVSRSISQGDFEEALVEVMLWEDHKSLVDVVEDWKVPFAKFTGHVNEKLAKVREQRELLQWPTTLRRLVAFALGEGVELPAPLPGRPPRAKGQLL